VAGIVIGAIAPHGGIAVSELCTEEELGIAAATRAGMEELGRRFAHARPEAVVILTPHNVHVEGAIAVIVAGEVEGVVGGESGQAISLTCPVDLELAVATLLGFTSAGIPAVGVSFGGNDPSEATMPMDWGALIPLWFMGGRCEPPPAVVLVSPARDLPPETHVAAGSVLAAAARATGRRVALIASADHGHAHDVEGPYGYDPASALYDDLVVGLVRENRLDGLLQIEPAFVETAQADSFWQMLVLHGATDGSFDVDLLSYEAPTYFGMMCASFTPRARRLIASSDQPV
jgi:aromatic ring-opening dioxygenase LigB subunit